MLIYYPSSDASFREDLEETFQVSKALAVLLDLHISTCGLVALPVCFHSEDPNSFGNYKFLMTERRTKAKAQTLKLFQLLSKPEVDQLKHPEFDPFREALKKGSFSMRTKKLKSGSVTAKVIASVTDKTDKLSFFKEIHRSTTNEQGPQPRDPKSGSPKDFLRLFGEGSALQENTFTQFTQTSVSIEDEAEFQRMMDTERFYKSLTWNRVDAFLTDRSPELFTWPELENCPGNQLHDITGSPLNEIGLFQVIDYHVGESSPPIKRRRGPLQDYVEQGLREMGGSAYWQEDDRIERLRKLAYKLATHLRMARAKRDTDLSKAIQHWTEDMEWLHQEYYLPLKNPFFEWPDNP